LVGEQDCVFFVVCAKYFKVFLNTFKNYRRLRKCARHLCVCCLLERGDSAPALPLSRYITTHRWHCYRAAYLLVISLHAFFKSILRLPANLFAPVGFLCFY